MSKILKAPAKIFLIASLVLGILYAAFVPYGAGFDEERHLSRIYYMSLGEMMPNFPKPRINKEVFDLSYQRRYIQSPAFDMYTQEALSQPFSRAEDAYQYGYKTQSIYSPVIFLPQALIGRLLWWKFNFSILLTIMLQRLVGVLIYAIGTYFAIRKLPFGKWMLALLALTPAALYQAATLNADGFTNAASFLFIAWVLAIYQDEKDGVQKSSVWVLIFLMLWLGVAKPGAIILLPLLLLLVKHSFPSKRWLALLWAGVLTAVVLNVGWWALAAQNSTFGGEGRQSILGELSSLSSNLLGFIGLVFQSLWLTAPSLLKGWVAGFGFGAGQVPALVYWFWLPVVALAWLLEEKRIQLERPVRIFLAGMGILSFLGIYTMVFIPSHVYGGLTALAKHGRYLLPFVPLVFLGITGLYTLKLKFQKPILASVLSFFLLAQVFYAIGIYTTYYTYCTYDAYAGDACSLPIYKNIEKEDAGSALLNNESQITQSFTKFCGELESIDLYINQKADDLQGDLLVSLLDTDGDLLWDGSIPADEIRNLAYLNIPLDGLTETNLDVYLIQLSTTGMPDEGLGFALTYADFYPGELSINGQPEDRDLLIHYVCTTP